MKKLSAKIYLFFLLSLPSLVRAKPILGNLRGENKAKDLPAIETLIKNISSIITNAAGAIAVLMIIIGGITYITSAGNSERIEKGKKTLTYAILGLLLVILAKVILKIFTNILGGDYR